MTRYPVRTMLGEIVLDLRRGDECGWMSGRSGHASAVDGATFPRAPGFIAGPVAVLTAPRYWLDSLAPWPTRAEQERQENARRRDMLRLEARAHGLTPERVVELLKASGHGAEYVKAWEERI